MRDDELATLHVLLTYFNREESSSARTFPDDIVDELDDHGIDRDAAHAAGAFAHRWAPGHPRLTGSAGANGRALYAIGAAQRMTDILNRGDDIHAAVRAEKAHWDGYVAEASRLAAAHHNQQIADGWPVGTFPDVSTPESEMEN